MAIIDYPPIALTYPHGIEFYQRMELPDRNML